MTGAAAPVLPLVPVGRRDVRVTRLVFGGAPLGGLFTALTDEVLTWVTPVASGGGGKAEVVWRKAK